LTVWVKVAILVITIKEHMNTKLNVNKIEGVKFLRTGELYSGEILITDFGMEGINEESFYVVLNDGQIVEVKA